MLAQNGKNDDTPRTKQPPQQEKNRSTSSSERMKEIG